MVKITTFKYLEGNKKNGGEGGRGEGDDVNSDAVNHFHVKSGSEDRSIGVSDEKNYDYDNDRLCNTKHNSYMSSKIYNDRL